MRERIILYSSLAIVLIAAGIFYLVSNRQPATAQTTSTDLSQYLVQVTNLPPQKDFFTATDYPKKVDAQVLIYNMITPTAYTMLGPNEGKDGDIYFVRLSGTNVSGDPNYPASAAFLDMIAQGKGIGVRGSLVFGTLYNPGTSGLPKGAIVKVIVPKEVYRHPSNNSAWLESDNATLDILDVHEKTAIQVFKSNDEK